MATELEFKIDRFQREERFLLQFTYEQLNDLRDLMHEGMDWQRVQLMIANIEDRGDAL